MSSNINPRRCRKWNKNGICRGIFFVFYSIRLLSFTINGHNIESERFHGQTLIKYASFRSACWDYFLFNKTLRNEINRKSLNWGWIISWRPLKCSNRLLLWKKLSCASLHIINVAFLDLILSLALSIRVTNEGGGGGALFNSHSGFWNKRLIIFILWKGWRD